MKDLVICECCGTSFETSSNHEVCDTCLNTETRTRCVDSKTTALRKTAKSLGAKALKGSAKQKKWAESIRENFILSAYDIEALKTYIVSPSFHTAKFWIENRNNENLENDLIELVRITKLGNLGDIAAIEEHAALSKKLFIA